MSADASTSWWRSSRVALLSLVVIVPAALLAALSVDAIDYLNAQPRDTTRVPAGETGRLGGLDVRVLDSWSVEGGSREAEDYGVPDDRVLTSVTLEFDPSDAGEEFTGCRVSLLEPGSGTRWKPSTSGIDYWPGEGLPDDVPLTCAAFDASYPVEETFVLPGDVADDVVVELVIGSELPRVLLLELR